MGEERITAAKRAPAGVFGYAAGKSIIAKRLVKLFPSHKAYTEPFCGSAALYFTKEAAPVEALNDINPDLIDAFKAIQTLSPKEREELGRKNWTGDAKLFKRLFKSSPTSKVDRLHRFLYLKNFSYGMGGNSFTPNAGGRQCSAVKRIDRLQPRMKNTIITCDDYEKAITAHDSKDAFHFIDPPYAGYNAAGRGVGEKDFDEPRFRKVLDNIKGRFLVTYGTKGKLDTSGYELKRMRQPRTLRSMRGTSDDRFITHLVMSNFKVANKSLGDGIELDDVVGILDSSDEGDRLMVTGSRMSVSVPEQLTKREWQNEDPSLAYPETPGPLPALIRARFLEKRVEIDLCADGAGWTFEAQRSDAIGDPRAVAKSFSAQGSRFFSPMVDGVSARELGDEVATDVVNVDRPCVEYGLQTKNLHEYFVCKGEESGVVQVTRDESVGEVHPWMATFVDRFPSALYDFSVLKSGAPMPPPGVSALPQSLEKFVPIAMRYWEMRGDEATGARNALAASKILSGSNIAFVDGEMCRVTQKFDLDDSPQKVAEYTPEWPLEKAATLVPEGAELVEVFSPDRDALAKVDGVDRVVYCDGGEAIDGTLDLLAKGLLARDGHFVVSAYDSPGARAALEKMGRVFKFRPSSSSPAESSSRVFVASFPVFEDVEWLQKMIVTPVAADADPKKAKPALYSGEADEVRDLGKGDMVTGGPGTLLPAQGNVDADRIRRAVERTVAAKQFRITEKASGETEDEQIVYGIVLEPDTVDAQNDVYSAEEVRASAHKYMEDFQNVGLMHKKEINQKAKVIECYLAPCDFAMGGQKVKKGTWLMAVHVLDAELWKDVKAGGLTGFSIGGSAMRTPEETSKAMRKTEIKGIPITIDRPKGYVQRGRDDAGNAWEREYKVDYGYIPRTKGGDGEGLDVFVGPNPDADTAYWIAQKKADGTFDEYKVVMGANSPEEARKIYGDHVPDKYFGEMFPMGVEQMKALLNKEPSHVMSA